MYENTFKSDWEHSCLIIGRNWFRSKECVLIKPANGMMTVSVTMWSRAHVSVCCLEPSVRSYWTQQSKYVSFVHFHPFPQNIEIYQKVCCELKTKYLRYLFCKVVGSEEFLAANPTQNNLTLKTNPKYWIVYFYNLETNCSEIES